MAAASQPCVVLLRSALTGEDMGSLRLEQAAMPATLWELKERVAQLTEVPTFHQKLMYKDQWLTRKTPELLEEMLSLPEVVLTLLKDASVSNVAGTHLSKSPSCLCTPGPNEVCWGYRESVKQECPQCREIINEKPITVTEGGRMNGDSYGWAFLNCPECGLRQKHGWDDHD
mmetsp:Transcript_83644/g.132547  ORF Transcript_83644/g.132547 Transcript_83644/m.132547 type:complete len:172 (+) Transcript_83644:43-558(+)